MSEKSQEIWTEGRHLGSCLEVRNKEDWYKEIITVRWMQEIACILQKDDNTSKHIAEKTTDGFRI